MLLVSNACGGRCGSTRRLAPGISGREVAFLKRGPQAARASHLFDGRQLPALAYRSLNVRTAKVRFRDMTRGIYRELNGWGNQHSARIRYDDGDEVDLSEDRYRAQGYDPPFDKLPWKAVGQMPPR